MEQSRMRDELNDIVTCRSKHHSPKMSSFTGFSDADIRRLKNGQKPTQKVEGNESRAPKQKKITNHKYLISKTLLSDLHPIPEEAKLSSEPINKPQAVIKSDLNVKEHEHEKVEKKTTEQNSNVNIDKKEKEQDGNIAITKKQKSQDFNIDTEIKHHNYNDEKKIDLEEFQTKQKLMEEQNRRRKELLTKALEDRTKRTLEEQQRLTAIQGEFKQLDANLSNDVKILRKQIELASVEYMEAQKKYCRIEKDFLDAKLYLHQKLERKEMLTEYLCAIIEKNEERKAEKLNELLEKLNVVGDGVQCPEVSTSNN